MSAMLKALLRLAVAVMCLFGPVAAAAPVEGPGAAATPVPAERSYTVHRAKGIVEKLDAAARRVTIKHGPVPSLDWSAGTTTFDVGERVSLDGIHAGNEVDFEFTPGDKGGYRITTLSKSAAADGRAQLGAQVPL